MRTERCHQGEPRHRDATAHCAPRPESGFELETAVAGSMPAPVSGRSSNEDAGLLKGYVDFASSDVIEGWARSVDRPVVPVCLDGQMLANQYREDLKAAGIGSGHHGFQFKNAREDVDPSRTDRGASRC